MERMIFIGRIFELSFDNRKEILILPINPATFEFSEAKQNQKINLTNMGEINLLGNRGLISGSLQSFFPAEKSPFFKRADRGAIDYIATLKKWKNADEPIRLIVSGTDINLAMAIDNLTYSGREGHDDIYFTLELSEYRYLNVPSVKVNSGVKDNGLKSRPDTSKNPREVVVKSQADTLWAMAVKYYGDGTRWTEIAKANNIADPRLMQAGQKVVIP